MLFTDILGTLRRQWLLVLLGLMVTAGCGLATLESVPPTYTVEAGVLLLPPQSSVPAGANPLLAMGGLGAAVDVLARALQDDQNVRALQDQGADADFTVIHDLTTSAPVLQVTSSGDNPADALRTLDIVTGSVPTVLSKVQEGLEMGKSSYITSTVVTRDTEPRIVRKGQIRILVAVLALGGLSTIFVAALVDALLTRRETRRVQQFDELPPPHTHEERSDIDGQSRATPLHPTVRTFSRRRRSQATPSVGDRPKAR